jgi:ABC-type glycerol-3-phosphate transport system substrate-binding protein
MKKNNKIIKSVVLFLLIALIPVVGFTILNKNIKLNSIINDDNGELEGNISFVSNRTDKSKELNLLIKEFEEIHPKVKVNLELIGDADEILQRRASVGELPDITLVPGVIDESEYNKYFLPLDDLGFNEENIYNYSVGVGGDKKLYTLTTSISWQGVIYNKEIFNNANIEKLPKTNKEFFEVCEKIKKMGLTPVALNYRQQWIMSMWTESIPYLLDTKLEDNVIVKSKDILNDDSAVRKSLDFARQIVRSGYCENDLLNYDWEQCKHDIRDKKIAMIIWNSDFKYQLEDMGVSKDEFGMFPIPESKIIKVDGDYKFAVSKNTEYPEVAKKFLKFIFNDDRYSKAVNIMSSLKNSERNIEMLKELEEFNLPIGLQENAAENKTAKDSEIHNEYLNLKRSVGLDGDFTQKYVISLDPKFIREEINEKWKEYRAKIQAQ